MDIKLKEPLYIFSNGKEYIVRQGTVGVEKNRIVFFYDATKTSAIGFSRDYCLENPQTFQVSRTLVDKEVSKKDVLKIIEEYNRRECSLEDVISKINLL